ncbi:hypothetical protein GR211_05095 [Rhizobium leguminosarum]|uniref:phage exclusion protein Lit family protein n=1 Tax=Rhizobium ruizarguesonis TaxID=2081791 RepID=UPI0013BE75CD|nr:phage exclusion protein Lit family protein [Rhizobium ruizarguesonis]NEJ12303.1 hypothetical protein [Rhizobium ruizarguesonis]NEK26286.1 hypothetical protein [Rhizobium ruizarguesonis]
MAVTTEEATFSLFKIVERTPFNIAPERAELLANEIFGKRGWRLGAVHTKANFYARPEEAAVDVSFAGMASLWCLSYAAFHIFDVGCRAQRTLKLPGPATVDVGKEFHELQLQNYIGFARELFKANLNWRPDIQMPVANAGFDTPDGLINNVFFGALSWIILHEIGHVHYNHLEHIPPGQRVSQEFQADNFATTWILDDAGAGRQREFRILMITVALTWLFLCELERGQGDTHPPTIIRFRAASSIFSAGQRSAGLQYSSYLLKAVLDPKTESPLFEDAMEMFEWTSTRLEELFPVR